MRYILHGGLIISILSILSACVSTVEPLLVQGPVLKRQKQKVLNLRKKLEATAGEKEKMERRAEELQREIDEAELALIKHQIDEYERHPQKEISLFIEEREALYRLMQTEGSSHSADAQIELDRILRIITELSDEAKHVY